MKRRLGLAGAVVAIVVIALALRSTHDAPAPAPAAATAHDEQHVLVATRERPRGLPAVGSTAPYPELGTAGLTRDDPVTAYRKANVYPPGSHPLTREHSDLLHPNKRYEQFRTTQADDGVTYLFTADRVFAFGDDVVTSTLEVRGAKSVTIIASLVAVNAPNATPIPIPYTEHAGVWTAHFAPSTLHLMKQTELGMYIEFDPGTGSHERAHYNLQYTPDAGTPAHFTGVFSDGIVAGSLVIHAGLDVAMAGSYVIDCNLYDASDNPVAWTHWHGDFATGPQAADLQFFGKVIVDASAHGPFHIGQLRGQRFDPGHVPDLEQIPPYAGTYATQPYATSDFSPAEYDSAEKQRTLQFLTEQQQRGVHQAGAAPGKPGAAGDDH